jgi:hypothetical protein
MIIAAVLLGVIQLVGFAGLSWFLRLYFDRKQAEIEARLDAVVREWVVAESPDKPSKLALFIEAAGSTVGSAAARSIMATLSASDSHAARAANAAVDGLQAQQNPIIALLTGAKRGKGAAVMRLAEMLGPLLGGKGNGAGDGAEYTGRRHR